MHRPTDASLTPRFAVRGLFALIVLVFSSPLCAAATLYVSQDGNDNNSGTATSPYKTIQAAVNNASSGDTITLHASTFSGNGNRDIDFAGKSLTVNSDNGAARTVVDCGGTNQEQHRAFYLHTKEINVLFDGLTVKNANDNGAFNIGQDCTVKIIKCTFTSNTQTGVSNNGTVTLTGCTFAGNTANDNGGGIENRSTATLTGCTFTGNSGRYTGGIKNDGTVTLTGCKFTGNSGSSGALWNSGPATLTDCTFTGNNGASGGGIENGGIAALTGCTFTGNTSSNDGGGLHNAGTATLTGCAFTGNTSNTAGGGIFNDNTMTLTNCIVSSNITTAGNGGESATHAPLQYVFAAFQAISPRPHPINKHQRKGAA